MSFDAHKNGGYGLVATAPSPATTGTSLTLSSGHGERFPQPPYASGGFNCPVWPANALPIFTGAGINAEVVRVTNIVGDVVTIERKVEGATARAIVVGDQFADAITAKNLTDVETAVTTEQARAETAEALKASKSEIAPLKTDGTLAEDLDTNAVSEKAIKTYADLKLAKASNLSDVASAPTARTNLGLGTAATHASTDFDAAGVAATAQATAEAAAEAEVDSEEFTRTAAVTAEEARAKAAEKAAKEEAEAAAVAKVKVETERAEAAEAVLEGEVDVEEARALAAEALLIPLAQKDAANGVAGLDAGGLIEEADLPVSVVTGSQRTATSTDAISSSDHVVFYDATGSLPPTNLTVAAVGSGGTFAKAIYFWKVTAIGGISGESVGSNEVTVEIILNGSATLKWSAAAGATGYKVYRAALPGMEIEATSLVVTLGNVLEYTDTGVATKAGHTPATNGGAFTATLPTAVGYTGMLTLEAISAGLNLVTLATTGGQTIEGSASGVLTLGSQSSGAPYRAVTLVSDTANWRIV
jgi:hypothetical protein